MGHCEHTAADQRIVIRVGNGTELLPKGRHALDLHIFLDVIEGAAADDLGHGLSSEVLRFGLRLRRAFRFRLVRHSIIALFRYRLFRHSLFCRILHTFFRLLHRALHGEGGRCRLLGPFKPRGETGDRQRTKAHDHRDHSSRLPPLAPGAHKTLVLRHHDQVVAHRSQGFKQSFPIHSATPSRSNTFLSFCRVRLNWDLTLPSGMP